jgi:dolichol-phosphate mannosyltransferase
MLKTTILLPTYNERENIGLVVPEIFAAHPDISVTVIDDNSPDGTAAIVSELMKKYPRLDLFSREKKEGLGRAYLAGIARALTTDTERIILMDADGSHGVEYLAPILEASKTHDLVIGSRYVAGGSIEKWEPWRFALSRYGNLYAWILTGLPVNDLTSGFQCFHASLLRKMDLKSIHASGYAFLIEMKFHAIHGARGSVAEVPIIFKNRRGGESKISRHIIREGLMTPLRLFPKRFSL